MKVPTPLAGLSPWPQARARTLFARVRRDVRPDDDVVTAFRDGQVTLRSNRREDGFTNAVEEIGYQGVRTGDLVIHSMDGFAGAIGVSESDGKASPVVHCYRPLAQVDARFYAYALRDLAVRGFIGSLAKGIRERSTAFDAETFRSLQLPMPPHQTQCAIANFLDSETARIDALIAKKTRVSSLLSERRRASIDRNVVPHVLGGVADRSSSAWPRTALKREAMLFTDGDWIESPYITDHGIRLLQTGNVGEGRFREQGFRYVSQETFESFGCTEVFSGDILISRLAGPVGCACLAPDLGVRMIASVDVVIMRPTADIDPEFAVLWLSSTAHLELADLLARGSIMQRLSRSQVGDMPIPLPPIEMQRQITASLNRQLSTIDSVLASLTRQIELLREHRQALITAAVTGQIEIPGVAA